MKRNVSVAVIALAVLLALGALAFARGEQSAPEPGRQTFAAPIDGVEVVIRESAPPQVAVRITAGLPSGCARQHSHSVSRSGDTITVTVLNSLPAGDPICTMIYGSYELTVELGSDFGIGKTYTLRVNDQTTTFKT